MDIVYFEVNNWFGGRDYPNAEPFRTWLCDAKGHQLAKDKWARENKICVKYGCYDMSMSYFVTAPREWVEKNCPVILLPENEKFLGKFKEGEDLPYGWLGDKNNQFLKYKEDNFGSIDLEETLNDWDPFGYYSDYDSDEDEDEEEEDE